MGWEVDLCDVDSAALERTRRQIYPMRYGAWDPAIRLFESKAVPTGGHDYIFIGTPPDSHLSLARQAIAEKPRAILVEKPVCGPGLEMAAEIDASLAKAGIAGFVGYDHVVASSIGRVEQLLQAGAVGKVVSIAVEFREHWGGILKAHPWLKGPADSYLAYWKRGGGALGEHSHAVNLWQHFAGIVGAGPVRQVTADLDYVSVDGAEYDRAAYLSLVTESGLRGGVVQDVVSLPVKKWARIHGVDGTIEWHCNYVPNEDAVMVHNVTTGESAEYRFKKTRSDDFLAELKHIDATMRADANASPIALRRGLDTMMVIAAGHRSAREGKAMQIESGFYTADAVRPFHN
jgi:predicted dehydrogenase